MKQTDTIQELQELSPLLAGIGNEMPYRAPAGYFETIEDRIQSVFSAEITPTEELRIPVNRTNIFQVPDGYFEHLPEKVLQKVQPQVPKITITEHRIWWRMAAAAILVLMLSTGIRYLLDIQRNSAFKNAIVAGLAIKDEQQFQNELNQLDDATLLHYLNNSITGSSATQQEEFIRQAAILDLPAETDLLDDDFLDTYLNNLEKTAIIN